MNTKNSLIGKIGTALIVGAGALAFIAGCDTNQDILIPVFAGRVNGEFIYLKENARRTRYNLQVFKTGDRVIEYQDFKADSTLDKIIVYKNKNGNLEIVIEYVKTDSIGRKLIEEHQPIYLGLLNAIPQEQYRQAQELTR